MTVNHHDLLHQEGDKPRTRLAQIDSFYDWIYRRGLARLEARGSLTHTRYPLLPRQKKRQK
jgi:hypothetical protein